MKRACSVIIVLLLSAWSVPATTPAVTISGTVTKTGGGPLKDVIMTLAKVTGAGLSDTTDSDGKFTLTNGVRALQMNSPQVTPLQFTLKGKNVFFSPASEKISGSVDIFSGNGRKTASVHFVNLQPATQSVKLPEFGPGLNIVRVTVDNKAYACSIVRLGNELYLRNEIHGATTGENFSLAKAASTIDDTLVAKKQGYTDKRTAITSYTMTNAAISMDTVPDVNCQVPAMPEFSALSAVTELPDPFKMMSGTRMTKKSEWTCRREEIKALAQKFIFGPKPPKPDNVTATYSSGTITVTVKVGGTSKNFTAKISGNSGAGPFGAIIAVGAMFGDPAPTYTTPSGVALITCSEQQIAKSDVNGRDPPAGIFYDLNPNYKTTGSLMAWAWGIGRLIDALEIPEMKTQTKIDPAKLAITGCSFAGKAALSIGAWEERLALTLPIESGAGGFVAWRVAEELAPPGKSGQNGCQYASEAYGEATWMGDAFQQFGNAVNKLPVDMHSVAALCAPRGLLATQALTAWLCPKGGWIAGCATHMVYDALGYPDNMGYLVAQTPQHCQKGNTALNEQDIYNAFCKKFLQGDNTAKTSPDVALKNTQGYSNTDAKYIPWTKPTLE